MAAEPMIAFPRLKARAEAYGAQQEERLRGSNETLQNILRAITVAAIADKPTVGRWAGEMAAAYEDWTQEGRHLSIMKRVGERWGVAKKVERDPEFAALVREFKAAVAATAGKGTGQAPGDLNRVEN